MLSVDPMVNPKRIRKPSRQETATKEWHDSLITEGCVGPEIAPPEVPVEECAWCKATDSLMVRTRHGTPVMACVDWEECGKRELARHKDPNVFHLQTPWDTKLPQ
jgi:hypothetical protein